MRIKGSYAYTIVLLVQFVLLVHLKRKYDLLYVLVNTSDIDTFWHAVSNASIALPQRDKQLTFNHSFVVVTACGRNVARFLPQFQQNMESIVSIFGDYRILVGESDSTDDTGVLLKNWSASNPNVFYYSYGHLTLTYSSRRTDRIAYCRNHLLSMALQKQWFARAQFLLVADIDVNGNAVLSLENFLTNFDYRLDDWGAMTASQSERYYDVWALRSVVVNYDCWKEVQKYSQSFDVAVKIFIEVHRKPIPKSHPLIPVQSAFGGFGVYQTRYLSNCTYDSSDDESTYGKCEHVAFNECVIRNGGRIFINPAFQNSDGLLP